MLSSHVKKSPLLWLQNKSRLSQRKVKWFGISNKVFFCWTMRELLDLEIVMQAHHRLPTRTKSF